MLYYYVCSCGRTGRAQPSAARARAQGDSHATGAAYFDRNDAPAYPGENPKSREHRIEVRS